MAANKLNTLVLLVNRVLQWSSAVIVMGITSYFIHRNLRGEHSKYTEVIVCTSESFLESMVQLSSANCTPLRIVHNVGCILPARLRIYLGFRSPQSPCHCN